MPSFFRQGAVPKHVSAVLWLALRPAGVPGRMFESLVLNKTTSCETSWDDYMYIYPPANDHISLTVWHFWVEDFPNFPILGYLSFSRVHFSQSLDIPQINWFRQISSKHHWPWAMDDGVAAWPSLLPALTIAWGRQKERSKKSMCDVETFLWQMSVYAHIQHNKVCIYIYV